MTKTVKQHCDVAGMSTDTDKPCFYAHDGTVGSLIRVFGTPQFRSTDEMFEALVNFSDEISGSLKVRGHSLSITFERSNNTDDALDDFFDPLIAASKAKDLDLKSSLDEMREIFGNNIVNERVLISVWTHKEVAVQAEYRKDLARRTDRFGRLPIKDEEVLHPDGPFESLAASHFAFVDLVDSALSNVGIHARILGAVRSGKDIARADLTEIRRALFYHETPSLWAPVEDPKYVKLPKKRSEDWSSVMAPSLNKQIMSSAATATSDLRSVKMGGRNHAFAIMDNFPRELTPFADFLRNVKQGIPFRFAIHFEGGERGSGLKSGLATILSGAGGDNKKISVNMRETADRMGMDSEPWVGARIQAVTWVEPFENDEVLSDRRSNLIRALSSWRSPSIFDSPNDPVRTLAETAPGMKTVSRTGAATLAPLHELCSALPFHMDAPLEDTGESSFITMDGKLAPFKAHSPLQTSWLNILVAPPGAGKSVLLNGLNIDFAAYYAGAKLPFICSIDVGVSSKGFISTLKAALPVERRDEVSYIALKNDQNAKEYFVNPFDIGLGRRAPLPREKGFVQNFILEILGTGSTVQSLLTPLAEELVTELYTKYSDIQLSTEPKIWQPSKDNYLEEQAKAVGYELREGATWWSVVDGLMALGYPDLAERAQRYAAPTLNDVIPLLVDPERKSRFGADLCNECQIRVSSALTQFPIFSNETRLDIGSTRVIAIDLEKVVKKSATTDAERSSNTLMFLVSRELFVKKVSGDNSELGLMSLPEDPHIANLYTQYWDKKYSEIQNSRKRMNYDEFHITGSSPAMTSQIDQDIRHGRKWGFEIFLASQKISDFEKLRDMASNIFVLKSETEADRLEMKSVFGFSDPVLEGVRRWVHGPKSDGSIIFVLRKTKIGESGMFLHNKIGARRLWALTTTLEDMQLRNELYLQTSDVNLSLNVLAKSFPKGTCVSHWKQILEEYRGDNIARFIAGNLLKTHAA